MSPEPDLVESLPQRLAEAVDCACLHGLLKGTADGRLTHAPFALTPSPISPSLHAQLEALTAPFNRMALAVARTPEFLAEVLAAAARVDPFTARLLKLAGGQRGRQPLALLATRSDYFAHAAPGAPVVPRQVELNLISASYPGLAGRVAALHAYLLAGTPLARQLVPNDPIRGMADAFLQAAERYGYPDARVLMVVQPGETNVFDQRLLEAALRARGLVTRRLGLEQIAQEGRLREGHLEVAGERMAIVYFRAGYGPEDYPGEEGFRARALIEASSAISVPDVPTQLAGTKKVQQVLSDPAVLQRFAGADAPAIGASFAGQFDLEQRLDTPQGPRAAWEAARDDPGRFVLKPQREGGGHNAFDAALAAKLAAMPAEERPAYVLMERIRPVQHTAVLVREGAAQRSTAVSEIGRFGVLLAEGDRVLLNQDVGYLVRTKGHETLEGGVSAGFGFLDTLLLDGPDSP